MSYNEYLVSILNHKVVEEKTINKKKRRAVGNEIFTINSLPGNSYRLMAKNYAVNDYPGYKIVHAKGTKMVFADNLKNGKRGNIEKIKEYFPEEDKYLVIYEGGGSDKIPPKDMREGNPTKLSRDERIFWLKQKTIPPNIRKFI